MKMSHLISALLLFVVASTASAKTAPPPPAAIDPIYQDVTSGAYFEAIPPNTGPALTIDLGVAGRLLLPPRFAEQEVFEVMRLYDLGPGYEDAVAVGLHARSADGGSQAFALVYNLQDRIGVLKAELPLRQYFIGFEQLELGGEPALVIHGASGAHFDDLWLYRFRNGKPELLLAQGSAAGVELRPDPATGNPQVWVGVENWADPQWNYVSGKRLCNVYGWTGKAFAFNPTLSTAPSTGVEARTQGYVQRVNGALQAPPAAP